MSECEWTNSAMAVCSMDGFVVLRFERPDGHKHFYEFDPESIQAIIDSLGRAQAGAEQWRKEHAQ